MTETPRITRDSLHKSERDRLSKVEQAFRVHTAALHGDGLNPIMVETLVNDLVNHPVVFHHLVTGDTAELDPDDAKAMRGFARDVVQSDEMAMRNLEFSSATRRAELEVAFFASLKPGEALTLKRRGDGTALDHAKETYISERLDERIV